MSKVPHPLTKLMALAKKLHVAETLEGALHFTDCSDCYLELLCPNHPDKVQKPKPNMTTVDEVIKQYYVEPMKKAWAHHESVSSKILGDDEPGCSLYQKAKKEMDEHDKHIKAHHEYAAKVKAKKATAHPYYDVYFDPITKSWVPYYKKGKGLTDLGSA